MKAQTVHTNLMLKLLGVLFTFGLAFSFFSTSAFAADATVANTKGATVATETTAKATSSDSSAKAAAVPAVTEKAASSTAAKAATVNEKTTAAKAQNTAITSAEDEVTVTGPEGMNTSTKLTYEHKH